MTSLHLKSKSFMTYRVTLYNWYIIWLCVWRFNVPPNTTSHD